MSMTRAPLRVAALAAVAVLAACGEQSLIEPGGPLREETTTQDTTVVAPPSAYEGEQEFQEVAAEVPSYGGHWYEGDTRVVALVDMSEKELALRVLDSREQPELGVPPEESTGGGTRFVQASFTFRQLSGWRDRSVDHVLAVAGANFVDVDEQKNRVVVGIADDGARSGVERELAAAGVPSGAAAIEVTGAGEQHTLTVWQRPLEGGWMITTPTPSRCNLGFNVLPPGGVPVFVTNSHCTPAFWGMDAVPFYQPTVAAANFVGTEVFDPVGWACAPAPWRCRRSDANVVRIAPNVGWWNRIVRTTWTSGVWAPGSVVPAPPAHPVGGNVPYPVLGQPIDKVGHGGGWTRGRVRRTCVAVVAPPPAPAFRRLLCQYFGTYYSNGGDSGSPVFIRSPATPSVRVTGLHWGAYPAIRESAFSPRGGVTADLGI